jgi:hypothetical protein
MNRHRTDGVSLGFGAVFLLIAGWWVISRSIGVWLPTLGWVLALGLIVLGGLGLVGALRGGNRNSAPTSTGGWPDEPTDD